MADIEKSCPNCQSDFTIDDQDRKFYAKISVPHPTLCPTCRRQRRLSYRNERYLYHRTCDLCQEKIISVFTQETPYTVYCNKCWWSDQWDITDYTHTYDPSRKFFEQYKEFTDKIPHLGLFQDTESENCQYTNYGLKNKNCYLALCAMSEDIYFSHGALASKSCVNCTKFYYCELCYDSVDLSKCYKVFFSQDCNNCSDSYFLKDCIGCSDCFCSAGLRNKKFVFENQQLSEQEYKERLSKIKFTNESIRQWKNRLAEISRTIPKKYMHGVGSENCTGDYIDYCRNVKDSFDMIEDAENCAYCDFVGGKAYDQYDCSYSGIGSTLCYEINGTSGFNNCQFCYYGGSLQDSEYCQFSYNSKKIFGCYGLQHKEYRIFNKQYEPEQYEALRSQIIEQMTKDGEYGEFFPIKLSSFPYNETVANEYYPLTKEQILQKGYAWRNPKPKTQIPGALTCTTCNGSFKPISQEEAFYSRFYMPIPDTCPECRHAERFAKRNPRHLHDRTCDNCQTSIRTTYAPDRPEKVYCEKCYLAAI